MMHFPDFRSYERAFQLITQVSGRAGRRATKGKVVLQTSDPNHALFRYVIENDVQGFLQDQLADRQEHFYPPYTRLVEITFKHTDKKIAVEMAYKFATELKQQLKGIRILGPGEPMISKIRNEYLMAIMVKINRDQGKLNEIKHTLSITATHLLEMKEYRSAKIVFDVDPA
jgi:primosomal protein N' (replication factor Y) (superfamily II helicase)